MNAIKFTISFALALIMFSYVSGYVFVLFQSFVTDIISETIGYAVIPIGLIIILLHLLLIINFHNAANRERKNKYGRVIVLSTVLAIISVITLISVIAESLCIMDICMFDFADVIVTYHKSYFLISTITIMFIYAAVSLLTVVLMYVNKKQQYHELNTIENLIEI